MSSPNIYNPYIKAKMKYIISQNKQKIHHKPHIQSTKLPLSPYVCTPPFCDELPKGNHDSSKGGAYREEPLASAKSACKA